ncbi:MAG: hypothetical protein MJ232_02805 [archaeon]|nr:hypothetical protein [archaeon]
MKEGIKVNEIPNDYYKIRLQELKDEVLEMKDKYTNLVEDTLQTCREYKKHNDELIQLSQIQLAYIKVLEEKLKIKKEND